MKSDEALIRQFVEDGDSKAFETLVGRRLPSIRRIVAAAGPRETEDRDDAVQEVLIRLHRSLPTYRFDAPLTTWIFRIARNVTLDEERKRRRTRGREIRAFVAETETNENSPGPEDQVLKKARTEELKELFYRLSEKDRQLLLLREQEELSMVEIGAVLGISPGTVKSRLSRARKRAKLLYEEAGS